MTAWFISDIHIKDINERRSIELLRFLSSIIKGERQATHIYVLGDIFDMWVSDADYFIKKFQGFVDLVLQLKNMGIEIVYFEGNHDVYVKHFWQTRLSIPTFDEPQYFQLGTYQLRLKHGDLINPEDETYLKYRKTIRHPLVEKILLPSFFVCCDITNSHSLSL